MHLSDRALNRALLARQGLLAPLRAPLADVVEAVGAIQAQHWPAVPVAVWSRAEQFDPNQLYAALAQGELVVGTSIRRTLHLVSAREHPTYAAAADGAGVNDWWRSSAPPTDQARRLRPDLLRFAADTRTADELVTFIEQWVAAHPDAFDQAELAVQRTYKWRPFVTSSTMVRAPANGGWSRKAPAAYRSAPRPATLEAPAALASAIRCHLRAFGPAAAADVAGWLGWRTPPVRQALERLAPELAQFTDEAGRTLYDLPDAPRPEPDLAAPVRLLPAFDSTLLAYASGHRERILPAAYQDEVYARANLQIRATFLVDGQVAGRWRSQATRRLATLTLTPFGQLRQADRDALVEQAGQLLRVTEPEAAQHRVEIAQL